MTIRLLKTSPWLHLHPTTQPCKYDFTLKPNDHMIIKNLPWTSPASDDSTMQIWLYPKIKWPYDYKKPPPDFTIWISENLSWTSPASDDSTMQIRLHFKTKWPYDYQKTFPGLHLHPVAQPGKYEFTLKPNDHMSTKNIPWTSPSSDDSTM